MVHDSKGSTSTLHGVVCATIFILFAISYLYFFQAPLLEMIQHAWSGGVTSYDYAWGTGILLGSLLLLTAVVSRFMPLPFYYAPAMLCMGLLTAVDVGPDGSVHTSLTWLILSAIIFVALLFASFSGREFLLFISGTEERGNRLSSGRAYPFLPLFWMAVFMGLTFLMGNTNRSLHTRLKAEHYCKLRQWDQALKAGLPQHDDNGAITMLRAVALANKGQLGERLFKYNIPPGTTSDCLLFGDVTDRSLRQGGKGTHLLSNGYRLWQTVGFVPRNRTVSARTLLTHELQRLQLLQDSLAVRDTITTPRPSTLNPHPSSLNPQPLSLTPAKDYLLCACLIDRDLKAFMSILPRYYSITDDLPRHYREACLLYHRLNHLPLPVDKREIAAEIADYDDFCAILKAHRDPVIRNAALRDSYFGTYWYYYYSE